MHPFADRWNHNSHYYPRILASAPTHPCRILDVGCGDGTFAAWAAAQGHAVTGLEPDVVGVVGGVHVVRGVAESLPFCDNAFDLVTMVMVLHHTRSEQALSEVRRVVRPGGRVVVLGYARDASPLDHARSAVDLVIDAVQRRRYRRWRPDVAMADPTVSWAATRAEVQRALPGSTWQRVPLWRYLATWTKPLPY